MRRALVTAAMVVALALTGCNLTPAPAPAQNAGTQAEQAKESAKANDAASSKKKVVILATSGTIAGVGEKGKSTGYESGTLSADKLLEAVPEIKDVANVEAIQVCNVNSDDITDSVWLQLAKKINELAKDPNVSGFVITHGTDTLEETAYFLNLTVKTDKPVVLTGSMRPSTSLSADGPMNLYEATCVATSDDCKRKGVLVVFADRIFSARTVTKTSTYTTTAVSAGEMGAIGIVRDGKAHLYETPDKRHTTASEFDVGALTSLPKVSILYFSVDADPELLEHAAKTSKGIVIAGAGNGVFSEAYKKAVEKLTIPVVISSRIDDGIIVPENLLCANTIAADNLPPQKAAVLLRLALAKGMGKDQIRAAFSEY